MARKSRCYKLDRSEESTEECLGKKPEPNKDVSLERAFLIFLFANCYITSVPIERDSARRVFVSSFWSKLPICCCWTFRPDGVLEVGC